MNDYTLKPTSTGGFGAIELCTPDISKSNFNTDLKEEGGGPKLRGWVGNDKEGIQLGVYLSPGSCRYAAIGKKNIGDKNNTVSVIPLEATSEFEAMKETRAIVYGTLDEESKQKLNKKLAGKKIAFYPLRTKNQIQKDRKRDIKQLNAPANIITYTKGLKPSATKHSGKIRLVLSTTQLQSRLKVKLYPTRLP